MSETGDHPMAHAMTTRTEAAAWLERRLRGAWEPQDQAEFDAWFKQSMSHRTAYWRVADAWNRADRLRVLGSPMRTGVKTPSKKQGTSSTFRVAAAAIVAMAAVGVSAISYTSKPALKSYSTTIGGRETLAFADGSEIDLNTDTAVRAEVTLERRRIWLDKGEAFFRIKHDASHPFVVFAGGHKVTDLGTKFIVRRDQNRVEVSLVEGRAQVDATNGTGSPATLKPGDVLVATANAMAITRKPAETFSDKLGWREGVIVFRHATLADAAAEFNRYSSTHLVVSSGAVSRLTVVGTFRVNDMKSFVEVAQTIFKLKVERHDNELLLSR